MMAIATPVTARPALPALQQTATPLPEFYSKQTFRVMKPGAKTALIIRIVSVFNQGNLKQICFTVNGASAKSLSVEQFCLTYSQRVQIAS